MASVVPTRCSPEHFRGEMSGQRAAEKGHSWALRPVRQKRRLSKQPLATRQAGPVELLIGPFGVSALIMCVAWATSPRGQLQGLSWQGCSSRPLPGGGACELCYI